MEWKHTDFPVKKKVNKEGHADRFLGKKKLFTIAESFGNILPYLLNDTVTWNVGIC